MIVEKKRHILKTVTYRLLSSLIGFGVAWATTGSVKIGAMLSFAELLYKPMTYYLHERFYYKYVKYGLKKEIPSD